MSEIRLGCSGWSYEDWIGTFYSSNITNKLMLPFYSKVFNTVEINTTFYALPRTPEITKHWAKIVPKDFIFSVKFPQEITHKTLGIASISSKESYIQDYYNKILPLQAKIGVILIQFPPKFKKDLPLLEEVISYCQSNYKYSIEFRNKSWIENNALVPDARNILEKNNIAYCIVSEPGPIPPINEITADFVYIRWHGLNPDYWYNYKYTDEQLEQEKKRLEGLSESTQVKKIFGYFNNHLNGQAPANCNYLLKLMKMKTVDPKSITAASLKMPKSQRSIDQFF